MTSVALVGRESKWIRQAIIRRAITEAGSLRGELGCRAAPYAYHEIIRTQDSNRRRQLETWFSQIWQYWRETIRGNQALPTFVQAEDLRYRMLASRTLDALPDLSDRVLLCDAIVYQCDLFCTRDWTTILKHRLDISGLPIEIVTPEEWWGRIRPYSALT